MAAKAAFDAMRYMDDPGNGGSGQLSLDGVVAAVVAAAPGTLAAHYYIFGAALIAAFVAVTLWCYCGRLIMAGIIGAVLFLSGVGIGLYSGVEIGEHNQLN
jgi:hypothetical protein